MMRQSGESDAYIHRVSVAADRIQDAIEWLLPYQAFFRVELVTTNGIKRQYHWKSIPKDWEYRRPADFIFFKHDQKIVSLFKLFFQ